MTDRQENKLSMYATVIEVCNANNAVWSGLPAFANALTNFSNTVDAISNTRITQETILTGIAQDKAALREAMARLAERVGNAVVAYASVTNNNALRNKVSYSYSELIRGRDTISADRCRVIYTEATAIVGDLADYGVDAALLTELDAAIVAYTQIITSPRAALTTRKTSTAELKNLFKQADEVLKNQMDTLAKMFRDTAPTFYSNYLNARIIVDLRGGSSGSSDTEEDGGDTGGDDKTP